MEKRKTAAALAAMEGRRPSKEKIIEALRAQAGIVAAAARVLKCSRTSLYTWMAEHTEIEDVLKEIRESVTDLAEGKLYENIEKGRSEDIRFYLRCHGRGRGYVEVTRVEGRDGGPVQVEITRPDALNGVDLSKLSEAEQDAYVSLLAKMEGRDPETLKKVTPTPVVA